MALEKCFSYAERSASLMPLLCLITSYGCRTDTATIVHSTLRTHTSIRMCIQLQGGERGANAFETRKGTHRVRGGGGVRQRRGLTTSDSSLSSTNNTDNSDKSTRTLKSEYYNVHVLYIIPMYNTLIAVEQ